MRASDPMPTLPKGAAALRALLLATLAERDSAIAERDSTAAERDASRERDALLAHNERLHHLLLKLKRMQFGARSERLPEDQLQLGLEDLEGAIAEGEARAEKRDPELHRDKVARRRASRGALPAHLPRIEVTLAPEDTACPCCRAAMVVIGTDSAERLDVIPAQFRVLVTHRPKLACRACEGVVVQAPAPPRLIEGGLPTEALVAHVLVSRYADHLPLYRQAQIMGRQGVLVDRATLAFWVGYAAAEVAPVVARLRERVLGSARVFADETVVPVLDPDEGARSGATSGRWRATTGPGAGQTRPRWSTATRRAVATSMPMPCWAATAASCSATATEPTRRWPRPRPALTARR